MSGESYNTDCPRCGGNLSGYRDWKPYDQVSAICLTCGFRVSTVTEIATLLEVNEAREEQELAPIVELAKPLPEWLEWGYEPVVIKKVRLDIDKIPESLYTLLLSELIKQFGKGYYDMWEITVVKEA